jgi:hypothetical protein
MGLISEYELPFLFLLWAFSLSRDSDGGDGAQHEL